jgi:hypothetical protein
MSCFPLYLLALAYDLMVWALGIRNLACAILVTAERPLPACGGEKAAVGMELPSRTSPPRTADAPVSSDIFVKRDALRAGHAKTG